MNRASKYCTYRSAGCPGGKWCGGRGNRHMTDREWRKAARIWHNRMNGRTRRYLDAT